MEEEESPAALRAKTGSEEPHRGYFINAVGFRGPEFAVRKSKGLTRIVVIGGSAVFDQNAKNASANDGKDWPHRVERLLREEGIEGVEVINAGVPGHASFDSFSRLYAQLWMYKPDYVLFYEAWNDIKYFRKLTPETPLTSLYQPGMQSNPFIEYQGFFDRLLSHSQLYVKVRNQYYSWKFRVGGEGIIPEAEYQNTYSSYGVKQYKLNVELIVDACRNIGATPILLTQATLVSANNSAEERKLIRYEYQSLTHSALVRAFEETYQVIRSVAQEKQVAVLDIAKELNGNVELFTDHVHLSEKGSEQVAQRVAEFMSSYFEKHHSRQS